MENHLLNMKGILSKETSDFKQGLEGGGGLDLESRVKFQYFHESRNFLEPFHESRG